MEHVPRYDNAPDGGTAVTDDPGQARSRDEIAAVMSDWKNVGRLMTAIGVPQTPQEELQEARAVSRIVATVHPPGGNVSESNATVQDDLEGAADDEEAIEALQFALHAQQGGKAVGLAVSYPAAGSIAASDFSVHPELAACARESLLDNPSRHLPGIGRARIGGKPVTICRDHVANRLAAAAVFGTGAVAEGRAKRLIGLLRLILERIEERRLRLAIDDVLRLSADVLHFDERAQRLCDAISRRDAFDLVAFQSIEEELVETIAATGLGRPLIGRARHPLPAAPELRDIQADIVLERIADVLGISDPRFDRSIQRSVAPLYSRLFFPVLAVTDALGRIELSKQCLCTWKRVPCSVPTVHFRFRPEVPAGYDLKVVGTIEISCRAPGRFDSDAFVLDILNFVQDRAIELFLASTGHLLDRVAQHAMVLAGTGSATLHLLRKNHGAPGEQSFSYYHAAGLAAAMQERGRDALGGVNDPPRMRGMGRESLLTGLPSCKGGQDLEDSNPKIWGEGIRSMAVFPLFLGHPNAAPAARRRDGLLYIHHSASHVISERTMENVRVFATVAASGISRVFDDLENRTLSRQVAAIERWRGTVLAQGKVDTSTLAEAALNITAADVVVLQQRRERTKCVDFPVTVTGRLLEAGRFRRDEPGFGVSCRSLIQSSEPIYADVATGHPRLGGRFGDFVAREHIQSVACVPLREESGRPLGVMFICYRSRDVFSHVVHATRSCGAFLVFSRVARTVIELVGNGISAVLGNTTARRLEQLDEQGRKVARSIGARPAPDAEALN
jgi:hypothetical protein